MAISDVRAALARGCLIPAHPLALTAARRLDERRQRALTRYYVAAGAGGVAVGVHTTQFAIRRPEVGLLRPVLELAAEELDRAGRALVRIGGVCGRTPQAVAEATLLRDLGYHAGLVSLADLPDVPLDDLVAHCRAVADVIPIMGFYLQPGVGGRELPHAFWRRFAGIPGVVAIKIAPFDRYRTQDVVRAVIDAGRDDIALYTGNDDAIVTDLLTPFACGGRERRIVGGLLGHVAVWTHRAVEWFERCRLAAATPALLRLGTEVTDANAAFFDPAHGFRGCIAGLHEVLRRQGLLAGVWCLDERDVLSPGQREEIDRVAAAYPHLADDAFVAAHLDEWLR
jgi:dihydrodipicolinate synthase/N-acetylneuraminate lyase